MTTAREIMHPDAKCVQEHQTLQDAAQMMRDLDVGALPICGDDDRLKGIITDRDIVVRCCAEGRDPASIQAGEFARELFWIRADADVSDVLDTMEEHQIRRLPVVEGHRLVGIISEADLVRRLPEDQIAEFTSRVYA